MAGIANGQEKNPAGMNSQRKKKEKTHIPVQILVHDEARYVPFPSLNEFTDPKKPFNLISLYSISLALLAVVYTYNF
jgi:hypothetical protein